MKFYVDESGKYLGGWDQNPPAGAIEVPTAPADARQGWDGSEWLPVAVDYARQDVEAMRLTAYAHPVNGSDRYFSESARMQAMGESGWEDVRAVGVARYTEIQKQYPWPEAAE